MRSRKLLAALLCLIAGTAGAMPVTYTTGSARWLLEGYTYLGPQSQPAETTFDYLPGEPGGGGMRIDANGNMAAFDRQASIQDFATGNDGYLFYQATITAEAYATVDADLPNGRAWASAELFTFAPMFLVLEAVQYVGSEPLLSTADYSTTFAIGSILQPGSYSPNFRRHGGAYAEATAGESVYVRNVSVMQFLFTTVNATPVPAPPALLLFGGGLIGLIWRRRARHQ